MANTLSPGSGGANAQSGGSLAQDWPGWLVSMLVIVAALYSFSPRSAPDFPATGLKSDQLLLTDAVVADGQRLVAVGEQGKILFSDSPRGPWKQASIEPNRGSTLTRAIYLSQGVLVAVGHDSWIIRSQDRGQTWKEVQFNGERSEPLLGIAGPFDGTLYAFGAFGQFQSSKDRGVSWQTETLVQEGGPAPKAVSADPTDIFAGAADLGGGLADSHINGMTQAGDGSLILVGERGLIARSTNRGQSWRVLPEKIYRGSFYGVLTLPSGRLLVYGMRGHAFYSDDHGKSWKQSNIPVDQSLHGSLVQRNGDILLLGASNTMLLSRDGGTSFIQVSEKGPHGVVTALAFENGELLKVGEGGMSLVKLAHNQ